MYVFHRGSDLRVDYLKELRKTVGHAPLLWAGAAVVIKDKDEKILLHLRSDTKTWGIPSGAVELGETLEDTAVREIFEETGLSISGLKLLYVFSGEDFHFKYPNGDEIYGITVLYSAENVSGELRCSDESLALKYFSLNDLPELEYKTSVILKKYAENFNLKGN